MNPSRFQGPSSSESVVPKLGKAVESPWTFEASFWPIPGLLGVNAKTGERIRYSLETPFARWLVRHAIQVASNQVLFQLGNRQICVLDLESRKIAVVCFGRGAIAVTDFTR